MVYDDMRHAVDRRMRRYTALPGWLGAPLMVAFAEQRLDLSIDDVKPADHIGKLPCPVFIISGTKDDRTWPEDTQRLFEAAKEPKELWMIDGARHEDLFRFAGYEEKVQLLPATTSRIKRPIPCPPPHLQCRGPFSIREDHHHDTHRHRRRRIHGHDCNMIVPSASQTR